MKLLALVLLLTTSLASQTPDRAHVVIYRANQFTGKLRSPTVYCNEKPLARLQNGRFFTINLAPGKYAIRSADRGVGIQLDVEPGQHYFVRIEEAMGEWSTTQQINQVSKELGEKEKSKLKPIDTKMVIDKDEVILGD